MRFVAVGPIAVPLIVGSRQVDFDRVGEVFDEADAQALALEVASVRSAIGCYVFGMSPSGSDRRYPYYVGQACKQTLGQRTFQRQDKLPKYNDIVGNCGYAKAAAFVMFYPLITYTGRLARLRTNPALINRAEYTLIGLARAANVDLWNSKHRVGMDAFEIDGAFNSIRKTGPARVTRALFQL